jgi:hypothetical protein
LLLSHTIAWLFYQSSCHKAFAESMWGARMFAQEGYRWEIQCGEGRYSPWWLRMGHLKNEDGVGGKGHQHQLHECWWDVSHLVALRKSSEKTVVEPYLRNRGHNFLYIPKFYCELNLIERVWAGKGLHMKTHKLYTCLFVTNCWASIGLSEHRPHLKILLKGLQIWESMN